MELVVDVANDDFLIALRFAREGVFFRVDADDEANQTKVPERFGRVIFWM